MRRIPADMVVREACRLFATDVRSGRRYAGIVHARHATAVVLRQMRHSWTDIGRALGIDHSSAVRAVQFARPVVTEMAAQLSARLGVSQDTAPSVARMRDELTAAQQERDALAKEVARLTRELIAVRGAVGLAAPKPALRATRQTLGNVVVERLANGSIVTTKRVA